MVIRSVARRALWLVAVYAAIAAMGSALWWSFDSGPLVGDPVIVLADQSVDPVVRVYGDHPGLDPRSAARRTVDALQTAGGFDRSVLVVTIPTGSGWVDPDQIAATEAWAGGDIATVAMRYSSAPSGVVYALRPELATHSAHALLAEVTERLRALTPDTRPQLVVQGLSLGAQAGVAALTDPAIAELVDSALWQGLPGAHATSGHGAVVPTDSGPADGCTVTVVNPDDPVAALSWGLLRDPGRAISVLTSLPGSDSAAPGVGHRYRPVLPPPGCVSPVAQDSPPPQ